MIPAFNLPQFGLITRRLILRKPVFLLSALKWHFIRHLLKRKRFKSAMIAIHYKCNLKCRHCYEKRIAENPEKPLSLSEKRKAIQECLQLGVISIDFIGGESHLSPQFPALIKAAKPYRTYLSLTTNGYGLTKEKVSEFLRLGIDKLNVSVDSGIPWEHDHSRGRKGAFTHMMQTLDICRETGMDFSLNLLVYRNSTQSSGFKTIIDYAIKRKIKLSFKLAVPLGRWEKREEEMISDTDKGVIEALHKAYPFLTRDIYGNPNHTCPAFQDFFTITPFGDVLPCNALHVSYGNIKTQSLKSILDQSLKLKLPFSNYRGCPAAEDPDFVRTYLFKSFSGNQCPIPFQDVHEIKKVDPELCRHF